MKRVLPTGLNSVRIGTFVAFFVAFLHKPQRRQTRRTLVAPETDHWRPYIVAAYALATDPMAPGARVDR